MPKSCINADLSCKDQNMSMHCIWLSCCVSIQSSKGAVKPNLWTILAGKEEQLNFPLYL